MMKSVWLQDCLLFNHFCMETEVVNEKQQMASESITLCGVERSTIVYPEKILLFLLLQNHPQSQWEFAKWAQPYKKSIA